MNILLSRRSSKKDDVATRAQNIVGDSVREIQAGIQSGIKRLEEQDPRVVVHAAVLHQREPQGQRDAFAKSGVTVNALVIGVDSPGFGDLRQEEISELSSYYRTNVIVGTDAFVQTALGYEAYADAMARKLERELGTLVLGHAR